MKLRKHLHISSIIQYVLVYLLIYFCLDAFLKLYARFFYELHGPITDDTTIYWAVGRGILNGFRPYIDLWESKPPGIFLLSSFSYWLFDSMTFGGFMQGLALVGPAILLAVGITVYQKQWTSLRSCSLPMLGFIFGTLLGLYSGARSGEFQVESFGAFFGIMYLAILVFHDRIPRYWHIIACTTALSLAIGFKEPFLISCIAGALLMIKHPRQILDWIIWPTVFAAIFGALFMLLLGYLGPYITIHLADRFGDQIAINEAFFYRGLRINRLLFDVEAFSPLLRLGIVLMSFSFIYHRLREFKNITSTLLRCSSFIVAIFLIALSVGVGGEYWNHHYVFALPGYAALCFVFGQDAARYNKELLTRFLILGIGAVICLALFKLPVVNYGSRITHIQRDEAREIQIASVIDNVLDKCVVEQYLFIGGNGRKVYGYTKHSPLGPLFFQYGYLLNRPFFQNALESQLQQAEIVVLDRYDLGVKKQDAQPYIESNFTSNAWPCAPQGKLDTGGYKLLYRKQ